MIFAFESFFTHVFKDFIYFLPVTVEFFKEKLKELMALTDSNTFVAINQILLGAFKNTKTAFEIHEMVKLNISVENPSFAKFFAHQQAIIGAENKVDEK